MKKTFFSTGEFAKLCKVTKDTLFHYEAIGLLKPEMVKENGYRFYSFDQYFIMDMITNLKAAGTSLKDIKVYISEKSPEHYLSFLESRKKALKREQEKIIWMEQAIEEAIQKTKNGLEHKLELGPKLTLCEEEWYLITPFRIDYQEKEYLKKITQHFLYCEENKIATDFYIASFLEEKTVREGKFDQVDYIASKVKKPMDGSRFYRKPKGTYGVIRHQGFYDTMSKTYQKLLSFLEENHLAFEGMFYEMDLLNYLSLEREEDYIIEIQVKIEERRNS